MSACPTCGHDPFAPAIGVLGVQRTSVAVAKKIAPKTGTHRYQVLRALEASEDGLTDFELTDMLPELLLPTTAGARRGELVKLGLVVDSGVTRPNQRGNQAIVWKASGLAPWALHNPGAKVSV